MIFNKKIQAYAYFKIILIQRNQILDIFVSTTENGWLAFLGPSKREIVERQKS